VDEKFLEVKLERSFSLEANLEYSFYSVIDSAIVHLFEHLVAFMFFKKRKKKLNNF